MSDELNKEKYAKPVEVPKREWKECKLADITEPHKDTYIPNGKDHLNYIGLEHIEQESLRLNGIGKSSDVKSNKFLFNTNDILFGKLRVYFRKVVKPKFNGICSTDIWVFRAKEGINQDFLFYFLANWDFVNLADGGEGGTRMPRADWNFLSSTKWKVPPLPEQKAIASVLSSLDDKIDLLHRQNKTLEAMAETLFRKWFIVEVKEDWKETKIGNVLETVLGGTPSTKVKEYWDGDIPWINSGEVNNFRILNATKFITDLGLRKSNTKLLPKGTTAIAITGATLGQVSLLEIETCANQSVVGVLPNKVFSKEFIFLWIKHKINEIILNETGGAQPHINKNDINETEIILPDSESLVKVNKFIKPMFDKITNNSFQIRTLEKLRDTLLPKLMSGEVRVKI
ncbi:MAG: restriction endonuclease subunit S [Stygiobacter sp.]